MKSPMSPTYIRVHHLILADPAGLKLGTAHRDAAGVFIRFTRWMPSFVTLIGLLTCHIHSIHHIYHIEFISPPPCSLSSSVELYYYISRGYTWDVYSWCLAYAELACFRFTVLVAIMGKSRGLSCHTFSIAIGAWRCSSVTKAV